MGAVVLGWNPDQGSRWTCSYEACVQQRRDAQALLERTPVADWRLVPVGTRVHLRLLGSQRGLIGQGTVRSAPFLAADPARPGQMIHHVLIHWEALLPLDSPIPVQALEAAVPELPWRSTCARALTLSLEGAQQLDLMWSATTTAPAHDGSPAER